MKSLHIVLFVCLFSVAAVSAQNSPSAATQSASSASSQNDGKRGPVFRATKEQVTAAQRMLKTKGAYSGEPTGTLDPDTRASIKSFQKENGLRASGGLNRATLEKLGVELTESQKSIPVSDSSYAKASSASSSGKPRRAVFRATKEQVIEVQRLLRNGGMYSGDETGKLDDPTRDGLRKYQTANGLKVTGTLNQLTLEKMRIALTGKQKTGGGTK